jgi:plastocyanin
MKLALTLAALLLASACASDARDTGDDDVAGPDAGPSSVTRVDCASADIAATITTSGFAYTPTAVTVGVGDVVEIHPSGSHDAVADDGSFDVGFGEDACLRFDAPAAHTFRCTPHQFTATITVE